MAKREKKNGGQESTNAGDEPSVDPAAETVAADSDSGLEEVDASEAEAAQAEEPAPTADETESNDAAGEDEPPPPTSRMPSLPETRVEPAAGGRPPITRIPTNPTGESPLKSSVASGGEIHPSLLGAEIPTEDPRPELRSAYNVPADKVRRIETSETMGSRTMAARLMGAPDPSLPNDPAPPTMRDFGPTPQPLFPGDPMYAPEEAEVVASKRSVGFVNGRPAVRPGEVNPQRMAEARVTPGAQVREIVDGVIRGLVDGGEAFVTQGGRRFADVASDIRDFAESLRPELETLVPPALAGGSLERRELQFVSSAILARTMKVTADFEDDERMAFNAFAIGTIRGIIQGAVTIVTLVTRVPIPV